MPGKSSEPKYLGVSKSGDLWRFRISFKNQELQLAGFQSAAEAAAGYNHAAMLIKIYADLKADSYGTNILPEHVNISEGRKMQILRGVQKLLKDIQYDPEKVLSNYNPNKDDDWNVEYPDLPWLHYKPEIFDKHKNFSATESSSPFSSSSSSSSSSTPTDTYSSDHDPRRKKPRPGN